MGITIFTFLRGKLLHFFLGLCDYSDKFPKMFCSSCGGECLSIANFCHQCGQQLNLSQFSNKLASSVDKEKLLKEYFHRGYPYVAIVSLLEKRQGVRMHVRMLKRKLKNRPRNLGPVRRCFLATFTLTTCRSFIILNFICARKASQVQARKINDKMQQRVVKSLFSQSFLR